MKENVLRNVGLIMDGNGRWAQTQNKPRLEGHTQGIITMTSLIAHAFDKGVENIMCYGLSTENMSRPTTELSHIFDLMLDIYEKFVTMMTEKQASVVYVGNLDVLPGIVRASMQKAQNALNKFKGSGRTAYIGIAYGSRNEIVNAINTAIDSGERVTESSFLSSLDVPIDLDLIIRTGGERRLSNFMLYQSSYAELYFSDKFFPEFTGDDMDEAFDWYNNRKRRFGKI
ncbi:MAG: di-trans,poly-cis-decaprenylcistransferase [Clostridia bacterium]|nr:di-trans,poly-cis-decaprenylcistransferase [Clostridia bacterium]